MKTMPASAEVKIASAGTPVPPPALSGVVGIAVTRAKVWPLSVVLSTLPLRRNRYPVFGSVKYDATTASGQLVSVRTYILVNVRPPSSERRTTQPLPPSRITVSGVTACRRVRSSEVPVASPDQVAPPSSVRSAVPSSPIAYPRPATKSIARIVLPCGVGLPHCPPDWLTCTEAFAGQANARVSAAAEPSKALVFTHFSFSAGRFFKNGEGS